MHHQKPLTNFAPFYNWWDKLFGWYCPGQLAGGYKPKDLLDWEKKNKELKAKRKAEKQRQNGTANGQVPESTALQNGAANGVSNGIGNGLAAHS